MNEYYRDGVGATLHKHAAFYLFIRPSGRALSFQRQVRISVQKGGHDALDVRFSDSDVVVAKSEAVSGKLGDRAQVFGIE